MNRHVHFDKLRAASVVTRIVTQYRLPSCRAAQRIPGRVVSGRGRVTS